MIINKPTINFIHEARRSGKSHRIVEDLINYLIYSNKDHIGLITVDVENILGIITCNLNINTETVKITKSKKATVVEFDIGFQEEEKNLKKITLYTYLNFINEKSIFCLFPKKTQVMLDEFPFEMDKENSNILFEKLKKIEVEHIYCRYTSELFLLNETLFNLYNDTDDSYIDDLDIMLKHKFTEEEFIKHKNIRIKSCYKNPFYDIKIHERISNNFFKLTAGDVSELFKYDFLLTAGLANQRARDFYGFLFKRNSIKILDNYNYDKIKKLKDNIRGEAE